MVKQIILNVIGVITGVLLGWIIADFLLLL